MANPILFTDPSGNIPKDICDMLPPDEREDCREWNKCKSDPEPKPAPPQQPDDIKCDKVPGSIGPRVCKTYLALRDNVGWWNNYTLRSLTPQAFTGLTMRMEFNDSGGTGANRIDSTIQKEVAVRNFYAHCSYWAGRPCDSRSATDMFIFIAHKQLLSMSAREHMLIPKGVAPEDVSPEWISSEWVDKPGYYSDADFENGFLYPGQWISGIGSWNQPFDWGNISMIKDATKYSEAKTAIGGSLIGEPFYGEEEFYYKLGTGDSFVIMTFTQRRYWHGS
jgi:hypothetical protein